MPRRQGAASLRERAAVLLSGTPIEGPARRIYGAARGSVPNTLLSPSGAKARDYDRMTLQIARTALADGGGAIDIGAHEGSILRGLVKLSPGPHWAFEPIPASVKRLRRRFPGVTVEEVALADYEATAEFRFMPGAAAYSSLLVRPRIEDRRPVRRLAVRVRRLDDCIPEGIRVAFVKIDVEGAEAAVLRGARELLRRQRPTVVFECDPADLPGCAAALDGTGLHVSLLADYLAGIRRQGAEAARLGRERGEYYYVAAP